MRLAELVSSELWAPMGAEEDACFTVDPTGFACACGGLNATLRDLARFGQLYVAGGAADGGAADATSDGTAHAASPADPVPSDPDESDAAWRAGYT
mgnify:CR=1 FL=1